MVERVTECLELAFAGISLDLEEVPGGRISGSAVWDGFADLDQVDRQQQLRTVLRRDLGAEATLVGVILTYTPHELDAMKAA
jgi:hypothetical protein